MNVSNFGRKIFSVLLMAALALSTMAVFVPQVRQVYAAELFSDGFEGGDFSAWTTTDGSPSVVSSQANSGTYSAYKDIAGNGRYCSYKTVSSRSVCNLTFSYRFGSLPSDGDYIIIATVSVGWIGIADVILNNTGGTYYLKASAINGDAPKVAGTISPSVDTWYDFQLLATIDESVGELACIFDGSEIASDSNLDTGATNYTGVIIGNRWCDGFTGEVWWDDVTLTDTYTLSSEELNITINDPEAKYYNTTSIPLNVTVADADTIWYNIYNGTQFIGSNTTYTEATNIAPSFSTYGNELQLWVYANDTEGTEYSNTVIFGYFNYSEVAYANSGSNTDIQSAQDSISEGGVVCVPAGSYNFDAASPWADVDLDVGKSLFGAPSLRNATDFVNDWQTEMNISWAAPDGGATRFIYLTGTSSDYVTRFSGIQFNGYRIQNDSSTLRHYGLTLSGVDNGGTSSSELRVDHCNFYNLGGDAVYVGDDVKGVVDHNNFVNDINVYVEPAIANCTVYYGVCVAGPGSTYWGMDVSDIYGQYLNHTFFIEGNYFEGWRHTVASNHGAHYVYRYNVERGNGYGTVDAHGHEGGNNSTRAIEVYENDFGDPQNWGGVNMTVQLRGGAAIFTNNTVTDYDGDGSYVAVVVMAQYTPDEYETEQVHDTYIWNNTLDPEDTDLWDAVYGGVADNPIEEGVDFFLYAPSMENDSFQYNPYVYPHPLVSGESPTYYYLTVNCETGITTTPAEGEHQYLTGTNASITYTLDTGYQFDGWEGDASGSEKTVYVFMDSNKTVNATASLYSGWGGGGGVSWGRFWGYWWVIPTLAGALFVVFKKLKLENKLIQLAVIVVIEDLLLRILPIWILSNWIPLWTIFVLSVIFDTIVHSVERYSDIPRRAALAVGYNTVWYLLFLAGNLVSPYLGFIFGLAFHYTLDAYLLKRKQKQ